MKPRSKNPPPPREPQRLADDVEGHDELSPDHAWVKSATQLDDYLDAEVVDENGKLLGTLSCYWEGAEGGLVFCGIKMNDQQGVRVAPGDAAQISERHSWVRVAYPSSEIAGAPVYDCDQELDGDFERTVYEHYGVEDFQPHNELRYMASRR